MTHGMPEKLYQLMDTVADANMAIESVVALATRELRIFDATPRTLRDRGFGAPARIDLLRTLLIGSRAHRLRIALHDTRAIEAELPRLMLLLTQFSGQLEIHRTVGQAAEVHDTMIVADDAHFWRKPHIDHARSVMTLHDAVDAKPFIERFEEIWETSEIAASGSTIGL